MDYNHTYPTLYEDAGSGSSPTGNTNLLTWVKPCDSCGAPAAGSVYCHADAAYLCTTCDTRVHVANLVASHHKRVPLCESCEQTPAALTCRADAASLCAACDVLVHSANKLAGRHERIPILPLPSIFPENTNNGTINAAKENKGLNNEIFYEDEMNEYLDMAELNSCYEYLGDANQEEMMMPSHVMAVAATSTAEASTATYGYTGQMSHCVSISSLEASVVPDAAIIDISNSHLLAPNGIINPIITPTLQMHSDLNAVDREARVMRYKEKKRMRKFKKTIRYASRKAHAEARPRIKGRFAKRSDIELEVDEMFSPTSPSALSDQNYASMPWY